MTYGRYRIAIVGDGKIWSSSFRVETYEWVVYKVTPGYPGLRATFLDGSVHTWAVGPEARAIIKSNADGYLDRKDGMMRWLKLCERMVQ